MTTLIAFLSFTSTLAVLAYASYCDLKTRMVSDFVWLTGASAGAVLSAAGILTGQLQLLQLLASVATSAFLGFTLYYLGLIGGADALALLFLGLAVPAYPQGFPVCGDPLGIPVVATFSNAAFASLACPLAVFALNFADLVRGRNPFKGVEVGGLGDLLLLLFTTRRVSFEKLGLHYFPAEKVEFIDGRVVRKPTYFTKAEADVERAVAEVASNRELYADGILASPTVPMIVPLTIGLALSLIGNVALLAFAHLFK